MSPIYTDSESIKYYEENAKVFAEQTQLLNMSELYDRFLIHVKPGGYILDAGCGVGRDTKAFMDKGYLVSAFDGSKAMCTSASVYTGIGVECATFLEFEVADKFDAIWACASLLHVSKSNIVETLQHLSQFLRHGGAFYMSFKFGEGERHEGARSFLDMTESSLKEVVRQVKQLTVIDLWLTDDVRDESRQQWINTILVKD